MRNVVFIAGFLAVFPLGLALIGVFLLFDYATGPHQIDPGYWRMP
jgi:hypothetical protein